MSAPQNHTPTPPHGTRVVLHVGEHRKPKHAFVADKTLARHTVAHLIKVNQAVAR